MFYFPEIKQNRKNIVHFSLQNPKIFERVSPSNQIFERKVLLSALNSRTIFERDLLSSDSVAKSATQNLGFPETAFGGT